MYTLNPLHTTDNINLSFEKFSLGISIGYYIKIHSFEFKIKNDY